MSPATRLVAPNYARKDFPLNLLLPVPQSSPPPPVAERRCCGKGKVHKNRLFWANDLVPTVAFLNMQRELNQIKQWNLAVRMKQG